MDLLDVDDKDIKESNKKKRSTGLSIGDSLLNEVNRNTEIVINNPELAKVSKNILQNEYSKLETQLRNYFNIEGLSIGVKVPSIDNRTNITLSLNTTNLLEEQKELVYNSIGTVFADKFDIEFKVKEDVGDDLTKANQLETSLIPIDVSKVTAILRENNIADYSFSDGFLKFYTPISKFNVFKIENITNVLIKENLYNEQYKITTKPTKTDNITRMVRCNLFRKRLSLSNQSRQMQSWPRGDRNQTFRRLDSSSTEKERTFFKERLNICIKDYENMFQDALLTKEYVKLENYTNEVFKIFNIPKTKENYDSVSRDNTLLNILKDYV